MNFRVFDDAEALATAAAEALVAAIGGDRSVVALAGGSTPRRLYAHLGGPMRDEIAQKNVIWVTGDERFVPLDDAKSNGRMIHETLFRAGIPESHRFLRFDTSRATPDAAVARFEEEWRALGIEGIDVAVLGVGTDGHTASLFPGTAVLEVSDRVAARVDAAHLEKPRLTLTMPLLSAAKTKLFLAEGERKRDILKTIAEGVDVPAGIVDGGGGESWWFVDRAAYPG